MTARRTSQPARTADSTSTSRSRSGGGQASGRTTRGRRADRNPPEPLGSLTQQPATSGDSCRNCHGTAVTRLSMQLRDGTDVEFLSCHDCETRWWQEENRVIDVQSVLARSSRS